MNGHPASTWFDRVSSWVFYLAALLAIAAALLAGLSVANASAAIPAATIGFQSPLFKPFWAMIVSGFRMAGGLIVLFGLLGAALLAAFGLLVARMRQLIARVERLEGRLDAASAMAEIPAGFEDESSTAGSS